MANRGEHDNPASPRNRWQDERPPSSRALKIALIGAALILVIGILLYLKARHAPPALHDQIQNSNAPSLADAALYNGPAALIHAPHAFPG